MDINKAKVLLQKVLDCRSIKFVYYIDDYTNSLDLLLRFFDDNAVEALEAFSPSFPTSAIIAKQAQQPIEGILAEWLETLNLADREIVNRQIRNGKKNAFEDTAIQILGDICIQCSPEEWLEKYKYDFLSHIESREPVLLLFDKLLKSSHPLVHGRDGVALAENAVETVPEDLVYCGVFSQQFEPQDEYEQRKQYKNGVFPISKKRLTNSDCYSFVEGIINILWLKNVEFIKEQAIRLIKGASQSLIDRYSSIQPADYRQIIVKSSGIEGCRESDTMLRLIHIIFDTEIRNQLAGSSIEQSLLFQRHISDINTINEICPPKMQSVYNFDLVRSFNQDETFISGTTLNKLLTPLQNGDVFCVNDDKYYILLCQPCNISLRPFGGRRKETDLYDIGFWVPLVENLVLNNKLEKELARINQFVDNVDCIADAENSIRTLLEKHPKEPLPCLINDKQLAVDFSHFKTISLSLLDYTTFNESGELNVNAQISERLHPIQVKMLELLSKRHSNLKELEAQIKQLGIDGKIDAEKPLFKLLTWIAQFLGISPTIKDQNIVYPVKRIGHLRDVYSSDLLVQLSHYISRAGFPNSFT